MQRGKISRDEFMSGNRRHDAATSWIAQKARDDTMPGDFGVLNVPCPKCGGEITSATNNSNARNAISRLWKIVQPACLSRRRSRSSSQRHGRPAARFPQQAGFSVRRRAQNERGVQTGV
jgi:hypothetical protein